MIHVVKDFVHEIAVTLLSIASLFVARQQKQSPLCRNMQHIADCTLQFVCKQIIHFTRLRQWGRYGEGQEAVSVGPTFPVVPGAADMMEVLTKHAAT